MSTVDHGGPAFPYANREWSVEADAYVLCETTHGMTLRDYFASQVVSRFSDILPPDRAARDAYIVADAMLLERAK